MKTKLFYISLAILLSQNIFAQDINSSFYTQTKINPADSNQLFLRIENTNFFKNDEYFGGLTSGLTYIGAFIRPELVYQPYKNVKISAGLHLLKYSGLGTFSQMLPIFSFQYSPNQNIDFIMGSLNGGLNHQIIEPMYAFQNHLINNLENGAQFLFHNSKITLDVWLNWEKYIFKTSHSQEAILGGVHLNYILFGEKLKSNLKLDFQSIIAHKGGQFHNPEDKLQTLANTASGIIYTKKINSSIINTLGTENYYLTYNDASSNSVNPYTIGYAIFTNLFIENKYISLKAGYWTGEYYISSRGNPLFMSVSDKDHNFLLPRTELITGKIAFRKHLFSDIIFEARFESYMDLQQNQFEFSYSFYLIFNRDFFLKKL